MKIIIIIGIIAIVLFILSASKKDQNNNKKASYCPDESTYMEKYVGKEYRYLFFDNNGSKRDNYLGSNGGKYEQRIEYWSVDSSAIEELGYCFYQKRLYVVFHETGTYIYKNIGKETFAQMLFSESVGHFYNEYIKSKYQKER